MSKLMQALPPGVEGRIVWFGIIASAPADITKPVEVIIPEFDSKLRWGPCRWQARDDVSLPARGDECLVIFDNRRNPWVVSWWPF